LVAVPMEAVDGGQDAGQSAAEGTDTAAGSDVDSKKSGDYA